MAIKNKDFEIIDLTPENITEYGVCGYKDIDKHLELQRKVDWIKKYYPKGLRIKAIILKSGGYQGMIEYIPGQYAHRPVNAADYMFIHCIFVGFKKEHKGKGYASLLIEQCISDAQKKNMKGVAVVTRKGSFMAKKDIFIKHHFTLVDNAEPDFELLTFKFDKQAIDPKFANHSVKNFSKGLVITRSPQCPYSVKNVKAIINTARSMNLKPHLIELDDAESVQKSPCAFGTFCILNEGEILSHHPISHKNLKIL